MADRQAVFDRLLEGFVLGETELAEVRDARGAPAKELTEERVTVLEYDDPKEKKLARWKKVQFIFYDELLLNVSYVEADPPLTREKLHELLGEPDEAEDEGDDDTTEVFEVALDDEPMLSFTAHYDAAGKLEALSLCADMSEDLLDDGEEGEGEG